MNFENLIQKFNVQNILPNSEIWQHRFLGNSLGRYVAGLIVFIGLLMFLKMFKSIIVTRLRKITDKTKSNLDDFVMDFFEHKLFPILYFGAFYIAVLQLNLNPGIKKLVNSAGVIYLAFQVTGFGYKITEYFLKEKIDLRSKYKINDTTSAGILLFIKFLFWGLCTTFVLDNLGFDISAIIAGLGVGGVALALASQNILNDLFNYFVIFFDRPFEVGDFIIVGDFAGTIKKIGIKTTRIVSLSGEELIFANSDLTSSRVKNYRRMQMRRVVFELGATYDTPVDKMEKIPGIIKEIIDGIEETKFDRCHFKSYGAFSLNIETVYYVNGNDYTKYMDIQQDINFKIKRAFEKEVIEFAFPTQTLYVEKND